MKHWLADPALTPEQAAALQTAREQALHQIIRGVVAVAILAVAGFSLTAFVYGTWSLVGLYAILVAGLIALAALPRLPLRWRGALFVSLLYVVALIATVNVGLGSAARLFFVAFVVLVATIFGLRAGLAAGGLSLVTWLAFSVGFGLLGMAPSAPNSDAVFLDWISAGASMLLIMVALIIPQRQFLEARLRAVSGAQEMAELQETRGKLAEQAHTLERVSREAIQANQRLEELAGQHERRAALLALSAEVAQAAAGMHDLHELLHTSVDLIASRFNYYHAGLFLLDDAREWAVLRAANSEGGRAMLARGHRLRVGREGIVGRATSTGQPQIALDVGVDSSAAGAAPDAGAVHFAHPDLPETHSEVAVPIHARGELIGALDVQSVETNAFTGEDVRVLQTLADQIGVAIDNARLIQETQRRLAELQAIQQVTHTPQRSGSAAPLAFRYDGVDVMPLTGPVQPALDGEVLQVPLRFGGQDLGVLELRRAGEPWSADDRELTDAIAERMALALESAQLFEGTRARAQQLAALSQASLEFTGPQFSIDQVLAGVVRAARRLFNVDGAGIWLPVGAEEIVLSASENPGAAAPAGHRLRRGEGLAGRVFASGRALRVDDPPDWPEQPAAFQAALAVPMLWQGETLGVLDLTLAQPGRRFTPDDENVAQLFAAQAASTLENARLFAETQQRLGDLATINTISQALAAQLDRQALAETVGSKVSQAFGHDAFVALYDRQTNMVEIPYFTSDDGQRTSVPPFPLGQGLTSHVIQTRRPLLINTNTAERVAQLGARQQGRPAQSWLGVPILLGDDVLGVLSVQDLEQEGLFSDNDVRLLTTIAANVGVALQNVRLFEQTEQRAEDLAAVNRLSQALSTRLEINALSELVVDGLRGTFEVDSAYLSLYDPETNLISTPCMVDSGERILIDPMPLGRGLSTLIINSRQPLLINADAAQRVAELGAVISGMPARSFMGVPVLVGEDVLGVLVVQDLEHEGRFSESDLRLMTTMAANVGVAVQNARLFEQTEQRAAELAVVNELARAISEQLEPTQVLQTVYEQVQRITPLDGFFVTLYDHQTSLQSTPLIYEGGRRSEEDPRPLPSRGLIRHVIDTGEVVLINRTPEEVEAIALSPEQAMGHASQVAASLLYLPLHFGQQVGGVMSVQSYTYSAYSQRHVAVLTAVANHVVVALQNARLFEETERRAEQLATAGEVARATISVLNPDELIVQAVELIRDRFERSAGVYYAALFLVDETGQWARLRHATGNAGRVLLERQHRLEVGGNSMVGWSTANRRARIALDVGAEPVRFVNPLLPHTRSELALPLIVGDTVLGALDVQSTKSGAFSEADVAVLQTMADQIGIALRNAQLLTSTQRTQHLLAGAADVARVATASLDRGVLLSTTVDLIRDRFGFYHVSVFEVEPGSDVAVLRESTGEAGRGLKARAHQLTVGSRSLVGAATAQRQPVIVQDVTADPSYFANPLLPETRAEAVLPLLIGDTVVGALDVQSTQPHAFGEEDVAILKTVADQIAVALQNARLFERTSRQARRERLVVDITSKIRASSDMDSMLRTAVDELRRALGTSRAAVRFSPPASGAAERPPVSGEVASGPSDKAPSAQGAEQTENGNGAVAHGAVTEDPASSENNDTRANGSNGAYRNGANGAHGAGG